ncbi:transporter substrate-binding domain-containing protein [Pseudodesulfovibrio indicus]|uniref:substrate-binding periplasmic protein n=1 Tax=Pseudodesulfovibrio indicus TaxID=1716143 RepID=UPI00292CCA08
MKRIVFFCTVLCALLFSLPVHADGKPGKVTEVISAGPSWESFTNEDGTGLYHEVLEAVFALYGIKVRHEYVPSERADELVRLGWVDMMTCDDRAQLPLRLARYPLYANDYFVFYDKNRIGEWMGDETLRGKEVAAQKGFYHDWDFSVPVRIREMSSGVKCLEMVLLARSDFYVDDRVFIEDSIRESGEQPDRTRYLIRKAGNRSYHPVFATTPRSDLVIKMYDDGMSTLHKSGALRPIYEKWGHVYPDFDSF